MIVSAINRDTAIRKNIMDTLSQIKQGGKENIPVVIDTTESDVLVNFYVDREREQLLFSNSSGDFPERFAVKGSKTYFTPSDEQMNFAPTISDTFSQKLYYTKTFINGDNPTLSTYRNVDNLLFQNVIVSTKRNPDFAQNDNTAIIVVSGEKIEEKQTSDDLAVAFPVYEVYVQLNIFDWSNLSEEKRVDAAENVNNIIRDALYADRYRGGHATLFDQNVNGTYVGQIMILPSDAVLKAVLKIQCAFNVSSTTY